MGRGEKRLGWGRDGELKGGDGVGTEVLGWGENGNKMFTVSSSTTEQYNTTALLTCANTEVQPVLFPTK